MKLNIEQPVLFGRIPLPWHFFSSPSATFAMAKCLVSRHVVIGGLLLLVYFKINISSPGHSMAPTHPSAATTREAKYGEGKTSSPSVSVKNINSILPPVIHKSSRPRVLDNPANIFPLIESLANGSSPHFLTTLTGCRIARWLMPILGERPFRRDCYKEQVRALLPEPETTRVLSIETMGLVQTNDTIYITFDQVEDFVKDYLPVLEVEVVLISGERQYIRAPIQWAIDRILNSPRIIQWFCQNLPKYGGENPQHPKLASFPFGLKQRVTDDPLQPTNGKSYERVFRESLQVAAASFKNHGTLDPYLATTTLAKNNTIFAGYLSVASNVNARSQVTKTSQFLPPLEFYRSIASSRYVLSPNGDRPECYRHYEALGLGTAPITQLERFSGMFAHFEGSGLVFQDDLDVDATTWELQRLETCLDPQPTVNRNLILEEYWMEYVDWFVDRELTWWDRYHDPHGRPVKVDQILKKLSLK